VRTRGIPKQIWIKAIKKDIRVVSLTEDIAPTKQNGEK